MLSLFVPFMARHCFENQITSSVRRCFFLLLNHVLCSLPVKYSWIPKKMYFLLSNIPVLAIFVSLCFFVSITIYFLYFSLVALLFISSLWKLLSLEIYVMSVDKMNSFTTFKSYNFPLDSD